jgi:hypothetical protein
METYGLICKDELDRRLGDIFHIPEIYHFQMTGKKGDYN